MQELRGAHFTGKKEKRLKLSAISNLVTKTVLVCRDGGLSSKVDGVFTVTDHTRTHTHTQAPHLSHHNA